MDRHEKAERLAVAGIGLQDSAKMSHRFVPMAGPEQQAGQVHAERKIPGKRSNGVSQARDHGVLIIHAATPAMFVCLVRSDEFMSL